MGCEVHWGADEITVVGGPLCGIEVDMNAISDTVQTLGAVAVFAEGPTRVTGVGHIRHKETDRIGAFGDGASQGRRGSEGRRRRADHHPRYTWTCRDRHL